jgi:hypothetical protein
MTQVPIQEGIDFLKNECYIPLDQLEANHHYIYNSVEKKKNWAKKQS